MRVFLLEAALLAGFCSGSHAQSPSLANVKAYPESALVLATGAMLMGTLIFYPESELVAITCANDSTYTLPAQLVQGFAVKDPLPNQLPAQDTYLSTERVFRTFPLATSDNPHLAGWGFYEQLSQGPGPILLLRREQQLPQELAIPRMGTSANGLSNATASPLNITMYSSFSQRTTLYLRTAAGNLVRLRKPQHLLRYVPHQAPLLRAYARENKLHYANLRDLSFLVNQANTLLKAIP